MISLFTGIGGFDLAADVLGWDILLQSEIDEFCLQVLKKCFPGVPKYGDVNEINAKKYRGNVDVVAGGFPCQPFSNAGLQKGQEDPRFLWPPMYRVIQECRPTWVVAENVLGLISNADGVVFEQVCFDLESEGYEVQPFIVPAAGKDSFQERKRVWIVACLNSFGSKRIKLRRESILKHSDKRKSNYLTAHISRAGFNPSDITPGWMEWFMGFPIGWTELTPSEMRLTRE